MTVLQKLHTRWGIKKKTDWGKIGKIKDNGPERKEMKQDIRK